MKKLIFCLCFFCINSGYTSGLFNFSIPDNNTVIDCIPLKEKQVCHIYLTSEIQGANNYLAVYKTLNSLDNKGEVYLHLAGPGGLGSGLVYLLNIINNCKAKVIPVVDGPVSSAHAFLAVVNHNTVVNGDVYFYFHNISTTGMTEQLCVEQTGFDRGIAGYKKCMEDMPKITDFYNKTISKYVYPYLTKEEKELYDQGHDIIIDGKEFVKRINRRD